MLEVIEPGMYTTVQDAGRRGAGYLGVRHAGAADAIALAAANLLVGNAPSAAVLEMTLLGGSFAVGAGCLVGIAGANMEAHLDPGERPLHPGRSHWLERGTTLVFGPAIDGARTYLSLAGGIAAQQVLGSGSTDPIARFGGIDGRPLLRGDVLAAPATARREERSWPSDVPSSGVAREDGPRRMAIVRGPHADALGDDVAGLLTQRMWTVGTRSDRVGLRLDGESIAGAGEIILVSQPMLPGAVQLPPSGLPIVLMPDAPTIGGYPVPAVITEVDRPISGQLRPGDQVVFAWLDIDTARERLRHRDSLVAALASSW